jgi:4-alpha-glucanotransferase
MKIVFYLRFHTKFGQSLAITGNLPVLGNNDSARALSMSFLSDQLWQASIEIDSSETESLQYRYIFFDENGNTEKEAEKERSVEIRKTRHDLLLIDTWNNPGHYENSFYTAPFKEVFFKDSKKIKLKKSDSYTHQFKVKAPLLSSEEIVCLLGSSDTLQNWKTNKPILLTKKGNWYSVYLEIPASEFAMSYKYGVYNIKQETFVQFENGDNRILHNDGAADKKTIIHDGFLRLPINQWKGAAVAIPVFSLRSNNSFGVGEFNDIKLLVDWAQKAGLKMIQLLPVNDTSATHTWKDSYPYAAISAFALHPIYINLQKLAGKKAEHIIKALNRKQKQLNQLAEIDYEQVINFKLNALRELYELDKLDFLKENSFKEFFEDNQTWLMPYAAFCFLRDKYGTSDFSRWKTNSVYNEAEVERLCNPKSKTFSKIAFHLFVQYHLDLQLKDAVSYAHKRGIALKGDIPIGIYRYGCDAWTAPELYNMNMQAGAPPDDFAVKGQNWGFPTYNWKKMEEDHFDWWKQRFHQMSNYFDAFRIDHILGFFRIWSIPTDAVEGILGRFIPALPVYAMEFGERGIWFEYERYCKPYIVDGIIHQTFNSHSDFVKEHFLQQNGRGGYDLKEEFSTQRKVEEYFASQDATDENNKVKIGLFDLISNVILLEESNSNKQQFHFRISIDQTSSFQHLDNATKAKVWDLYINYFYQRQDQFWKKEAMKKLPALKDATEMLICGEDLGMVPHSVPEVMQALGILSLEIQRMPKNPSIEFFHPKDAPYLSVVTPSSHDMSTIRGWWEEDREKTQRFFNTFLGETGPAPYFCEPWINRAIVLQHLYSPAMWSVFQLQDLLGMSEKLKRQDPNEERINIPANSNHYWNYRIHIGLEQLIKEEEFNSELKDYITNSGRS